MRFTQGLTVLHKKLGVTGRVSKGLTLEDGTILWEFTYLDKEKGRKETITIQPVDAEYPSKSDLLNPK